MRELNKVQYVSKLLPTLAHCLNVDMGELIAMNKHKALHGLIEKYPTITYCEISFEVRKATEAEVYEALEYFHCSDGRYIYKGDIVSRADLAQELSQIDAKLIMTAWIKED